MLLYFLFFYNKNMLVAYTICTELFNDGGCSWHSMGSVAVKILHKNLQ